MATKAIDLGQSRVDLHLADLPKMLLGFFGVRTESEMPFETLLEDGPFSVRNYPMHAEIRNEEVGSRSAAAHRSFGRLFDYINGENWDAQKYAMTTPVIQRSREEGRWSTSFYLKGRIEDLPIPRTSAVKLYEVAEQTVAVIRFSGLVNDSVFEHQAGRLREWIARHDLVTLGKPELAQFDQPFSIPFLRRNEVRIAIEKL